MLVLCRRRRETVESFGWRWGLGRWEFGRSQRKVSTALAGAAGGERGGGSERRGPSGDIERAAHLPAICKPSGLARHMYSKI